MKISQSFLGSKDGSKFWWLPWFLANSLLFVILRYLVYLPSSDLATCCSGLLLWVNAPSELDWLLILRQVYASPIGVFYQTWTRLAQISSWRISTSFDEAQVKPDATRREPTHFYVRRLTRRDFYLVSLTVRHSIRNILTQDECNIWLWLEVNPWASWHRWGQVARTRLRNAYARIVFDFNCAVFIFGQTN